MIEPSDIAGLRSQADVSRFIAGRFASDYGAFVDAASKSVNRLLATDLCKARELVDSLKSVARHLPAKYKPNMIAMQARVNQWGGNHRQALSQYNEASALFRKQRDFRAVASIGQALLDTQMYLGLYSEAISTGKKSLRYFRRKGMQSSEARALSNLGNVYHRMDRNRLALSYYDKARRLLAGGSDVALATVDFNRANVFANLNRLDIAAQLYSSAGETYARANFPLYECKAKYSLAYVHFLRDEYSTALRMFEEVHSAFVELGDRRAAAITQLDLVEVNLHLNQLGTALHISKEVTDELKSLGMQYELAKLLYFVGITHQKLDELALADRILKQASKLFQREENSLWLGITSLAQAQLLFTKGRTRAAIDATRRARQLFRKSGDKRRSSDADIHLVRILLSSGDSQKGIYKARSLLKAKLVGYQVYDLNVALGQYFEREKQYGKALDYFRQASAILEKMVEGLHSDEIRFFFVLDRLDAYRGVVESLLNLGRFDSSFASALRTLSMVNQRRPDTTLSLDRVPKHLLEARSELRASIKKLSRESIGGQRSTAGTDSYYDSEQRLWSIERKIRGYTRRTSRRQPTGAQHHSASDMLRRGESIVCYHITREGEIGAFFGNRKNISWIPLKVRLERLQALVWELHFVTENTVYGLVSGDSCSDAQQYYLRTLHRLLVEPMAPRLVDSKLILVADDIFAQVPFLALIDEEGNWLKDTFRISSVVGPDGLRHRGRRKIAFARRRNAVFGVPGETIPAVTTESEMIGALFETAEVFMDEHADSESLRTNLARTRGFVHIAAHATRSSENPLFSQISMSDGPLYPFDLYAGGVKASLVTLSGCQTASPGLYYGNSYTLAKAFHQAGSRYVLASLWPVSDRHSASFMVLFYEALADTDQVPEAYYSAIDKMSCLSENPAFWSGFVLLGI